jgi:hypothetical protein
MPKKLETRRPPRIDRLNDKPFMPEGRDQPAMPADRAVFGE